LLRRRLTRVGTLLRTDEDFVQWRLHLDDRRGSKT